MNPLLLPAALQPRGRLIPLIFFIVGLCALVNSTRRLRLLKYLSRKNTKFYTANAEILPHPPLDAILQRGSSTACGAASLTWTDDWGRERKEIMLLHNARDLERIRESGKAEIAEMKGNGSPRDWLKRQTGVDISEDRLMLCTERRRKMLFVLIPFLISLVLALPMMIAAVWIYVSSTADILGNIKH